MEPRKAIKANYSEETITGWTKPPSDNEEAKLANSEKLVREAIAEDPVLGQKTVTVFGQGSYANDTNVRLNSDVDINVRYGSVFYFKIPDGRSREEFDLNNPSDYTFSEYKNAVEQALVRKFGRTDVVRGNKCITVKESATRVQTDVVPTWLYKRFYANKTKDDGVKFISDNGTEVVNFPLQHIENGKAKNSRTQKRFKRLTRVFRKIRYKMKDDGIPVDEGITSFLMECLVWNVPDSVFNEAENWTERLRNANAYLFRQTLTDEACKDWGEVSELLYLFRGNRKWTRPMVNSYLMQMWAYMGFEA